MNAPLTVSIIIDNYNYARFLRQAIDSALDQTYPDVEVVVVDDGSTDASREIIRSYGDRIRPVLKENGGQASAFNAGFAAARGEIIAFLDADDYLAPHAVAKIVAAWIPEVKILHHRLREVDASGHESGWNPSIDIKLDTGNVLPSLLRKGTYGSPPTSGLVYSRDLLQKILPVPEDDFRICADAYLLVNAPFFSPVTALDETLGYYRVHGANAHRETGPRRNWPRKKLEVVHRYRSIMHVLIKKLAQEHGLPDPDSSAWLNSAQLFEELLLRRSSGESTTKLWSVTAAILKKLCAETSAPATSRVRVAALSLLVCWAPRTFLARIYPNLF